MNYVYYTNGEEETQLPPKPYLTEQQKAQLVKEEEVYHAFNSQHEVDEESEEEVWKRIGIRELVKQGDVDGLNYLWSLGYALEHISFMTLIYNPSILTAFDVNTNLRRLSTETTWPTIMKMAMSVSAKEALELNEELNNLDKAIANHNPTINKLIIESIMKYDWFNQVHILVEHLELAQANVEKMSKKMLRLYLDGMNPNCTSFNSVLHAYKDTPQFKTMVKWWLSKHNTMYIDASILRRLRSWDPHRFVSLNNDGQSYRQFISGITSKHGPKAKRFHPSSVKYRGSMSYEVRTGKKPTWI